MEKVEMYRCDYCGQLFDTAEESGKHEQRHRNIDGANEMLQKGASLELINQRYGIWDKLPDYLKEVTKYNCFKITYWQCCDKPAYQITRIEMDGRLSLLGRGSWSGYYGESVKINNPDLKKVYQLNELFVYPTH